MTREVTVYAIAFKGLPITEAIRMLLEWKQEKDATHATVIISRREPKTKRVRA